VVHRHLDKVLGDELDVLDRRARGRRKTKKQNP
jgi:hypothetical protein